MSRLYADVVGQEVAVAQLCAAARSPVHAYLLVGAEGSGQRELVRSFAAALICDRGGCGECDHCARVLGGVHPDVVVRERTGPFITVDDARHIARLASLSPVEARRKVLVLVDLHLVREAAPALLKAIEEPPPTTVFVVLAEQVPPELVTIASRCVQVPLAPLGSGQVAAALVAEGVDETTAAEVAEASGGRLDRARLLASDPGFAARRQEWRSAPARLDGSGAAVVATADALLASVDTVLGPLGGRQAAELAQARDQARLHGERGGSRELEARHRREQRRLRVDELRLGLATLAGWYRDRLAEGTDVGACLQALEAVGDANEALSRNPNEALLLQALLVRLSRLGYSTASARVAQTEEQRTRNA